MDEDSIFSINQDNDDEIESPWQSFIVSYKYKVVSPPVLSCPICCSTEPIKPEEIFTLPCGHAIHFSCFGDMFKVALNSFNPIQCPYSGCRKDILLENIPSQMMNDYLDHMTKVYLSQSKYMETCYFCSQKYFTDSDCMNKNCPHCKAEYCQYCLEKPHLDYFCQKGHDLLTSQFRICKNCNMYIERSSGCLNVTCRCGYQFCFKCQSPKYGCSCSPGHGFYAVSYMNGNSTYYVCQCKQEICVCK